MHQLIRDIILIIAEYLSTHDQVSFALVSRKFNEAVKLILNKKRQILSDEYLNIIDIHIATRNIENKYYQKDDLWNVWESSIINTCSANIPKEHILNLVENIIHEKGKLILLFELCAKKDDGLMQIMLYKIFIEYYERELLHTILSRYSYHDDFINVIHAFIEKKEGLLVYLLQQKVFTKNDLDNLINKFCGDKQIRISDNTFKEMCLAGLTTCARCYGIFHDFKHFHFNGNTRSFNANAKRKNMLKH
jgi:hypothetical protein